jgi:flagellar motor switch protein FliN
MKQEEIDQLLAGAGGAPDAGGAASGEARPFAMPDLGGRGAQAAEQPVSERAFDLLMDVNLNVRIELGRCRMLVEDILKLKSGSVVSLDKLAGDPVDILVNEQLVARGDIMVINDVFCVRVTEILDPKARLVAVNK